MDILVTVLYIIACVFVFSLAVFIHEFGHFVAARALGLAVDVFSIGFGPALWKKKIGDVEYRFSAIPFGGYVSIPSLDPEGTKGVQGTADHAADPAVVETLAPWKQIVVAVAGPFGNVVLAVALAFLLAALPGTRFGELTTAIGAVPAGTPVAAGGLVAGDRILAVGGKAVGTWTDLTTEVQISGTRETPFRVVDSNGLERVVNITPKRDEVTGVCLIGAFSLANTNGAAAWMPDRNPVRQLAWDAGQIVRVLKALVTPRESGAAARAIGGPVNIAEALYRQARRDPYDALGFLRFLNVNLAMINLLPLPVLDGGLVLFALIALVIRRRVPKFFTDALSKFFMFALLALMLFLVYRDVVRSARIHRAQAAFEARPAACEPPENPTAEASK